MANDTTEQHHERVAIETRMGLKPLSPTWAKAEIFLGLSCAWAALHPTFLQHVVERPDTAMMCSFGLFVLGGYLAMAGSRSHLYRSANRLTAFLSQQIDDKK
jgi:hypothetical protein